MIALREARSYVTRHIESGHDQRLLDTFFDRFETGAYVVMANGQAVGSANFFARSKHRLSHIFAYRLVDPAGNGMSCAFACFDGQPRGMVDYLILLNHVFDVMQRGIEEDPNSRFDPTDLVARQLPIDGAFLIGGRPDDELPNLQHWQVTRPYISPPDSRKLLYGSVDAALNDGFS